MENLTEKLKNRILAQKLELWQGTLYDAGLDAKVATVVDNKQLQQASEKRVKEAIQAIEYLTSLLEEPDAPDEMQDQE